jgi:hypothetical protein
MFINGMARSTHQKPQFTDSSLSNEDNNPPKKKSTRGHKHSNNINCMDAFNDSASMHNNSGMPILRNDNSILNADNIALIPKFKTKTAKKKNTSKKVHKYKDEKKFSQTVLDPDARFNIIHNDSPEKKKLDNSYEDYFFYEIVDEDSFNIFFKLTEEYISKRLNDKILRLYNSLKRQITETVSNGLKQVHVYPDLIQKVINKTFNKTHKKKTFCEKLCGCCPCFREKEKYDLDSEHNMKERAENIDNEISNFVEELEEKFSEKNIEEFYVVNQEETENFAKEKSKVFFNKRGMKERLRLEVERYSKFFNIERIIEKQENTLETQNKKMNKLNDIKELNECIICMEKQRNIIFSPCNHLICCEECGYNKVSGECPECKMTIENKTITN